MDNQKASRDALSCSDLLGVLPCGVHATLWIPLISGLCNLQRCFDRGYGDHADIVRLSAGILRQWLRLPEDVHRTATEIKYALARQGFAYASAFCSLLQTRYSLHQQVAWRHRLVRARPAIKIRNLLEAGCLVYGAGAVGGLLVNWLRLHGFRVDGILDAYSELSSLGCVPVMRPELAEWHTRALPVVISLSDSECTIQRRLLTCGYSVLVTREELVSDD